jgi:hypothetical protein
MIRRTLAMFFLAAWSLAASAAPEAQLWARWAAHDEDSKWTLDHGAWDSFLRENVKPSADGINRVAYGKVTAADKAKLQSYLQKLQATAISKYPRAEQRAYWINLYNAETIKIVLDHYPVESILKISISPGLFAKGPWGKKLLKVEGEELALDDIEHRILRPLWKDPRTHYSVNCASLGCPNLAMRAYTPANTEELIEAGARAYVNHPRGAHVASGKLQVSSIYKWFKADFGGDDAGVIAHLKKYAEPKLAAQLAGIQSIDGDSYDWSLNDLR